MKKILFFSVLLLCGLSLFAQTPKYTTQRMADGTLIIICPSENDALLVLDGSYNLPDTFIVAVLLKGIYLEESPLSSEDFRVYILQGTKLVFDGNGGGVLGGGCQDFYNLNRNTEYYVMWKRERNDLLTRMNMLPGGSGRIAYSSMVIAIGDKNFTPITPVRR